jgi:hypothetical protein
VRFFRVPGMNDSSGGVAADECDALAAQIDWVELGKAPDSIVPARAVPATPAGSTWNCLQMGPGPHACPLPLSEGGSLQRHGIPGEGRELHLQVRSAN